MTATTEELRRIVERWHAGQEPIRAVGGVIHFHPDGIEPSDLQDPATAREVMQRL